jgi:hypothetical protein
MILTEGYDPDAVFHCEAFQERIYQGDICREAKYNEIQVAWSSMLQGKGIEGYILLG